MELKDYIPFLSIINILLFPLAAWFRSSLLDKVELIVGARLVTLEDKIDNNYVCKEVCEIQHINFSKGLEGISIRLDDLSKALVNYNTSLIQITTEISRRQHVDDERHSGHRGT